MNIEKIPTILPFVHAEAEAKVEETKVEFTKEQKDWMNTTFRERYSEIQEKARKDMEAERAKWEAEADAKMEAKLAELLGKKGGKKDDETKADTTKGSDEANPQLDEYKRIAKEARKTADEREKMLKQRETEMAQKDATILEMKKQTAINQATSGVGFVNMKAVLAMTSSAIEWDAENARFVVRNDDGEIMQGDDFKPITLKDFFVRFADENPYLVKSDVRGGAGSTAAGGSAAGIGAFAHIKSRADFGKDHKLRTQYIAKYGMDKYLAMPAK